MVHADSTHFDADISKEEVYAQILSSAESLFEGQRNWVCNLANAASLLWHAYHSLPSPSSAVNWAGFYVLDPLSPHLKSTEPTDPLNLSPSTSENQPEQLILGPFQGRVACQTISIGRGVCGTAASKGETQLVRDVEVFPGHIACDGATKSEIVVPVIADGRVVAVIDIDCEELAGFDEVDQRELEKLAGLLAKSCDWR